MRLEGQTRLGYFPTPAIVVDALRKAVAPPGILFAALDPCAGTGEALHRLTEHTQAIRYAVELDRHRAAEASRLLDHCLNEALADTLIEASAVSLLFLNPPYDDGAAHRLEYEFLKRASPTLMPGGILIYVVQERMLTHYHIRLHLLSRFEGIHGFRFPEKEYQAFQQIVVIGRRRDKTVWTGGGRGAILQAAGRQEIIPLGAFEDLPDHVARHGPWKIPFGKPLTLFTSTAVDAGEATRLIDKSPAAAWMKDTLGGRVAAMRRPLMALKKGHIVQLLLGGFLDNQIVSLETGGRPVPHAIRGFSRKLQEEVKEEEQTVIHERAHCGIALLNLITGELREMLF